MLRRLVAWGLLALLAPACGGGSGGTTPAPGGATVPTGTAGAAGSGAPVAADACALASPEVRLSDAPGDSVMAKVLADGGGYLLLWSDARTGAANVFSAHVTAAGAKAAPEAPLTTTTATATRPTAVDLGGANWIAAWEEIAGDALSVLARKLADSGAPTQVMNDGFQQARPGLASVGGQPVLVWMTLSKSDPNGATISAARLTGSGAMMGAPVAIGAGAPAHHPAIAANDAAVAVAYVAGVGQVKLALFDRSLTLTREIVVRDLPSGAANPAIAWDGQRWVVAWEDLRAGSDESIYAALVASDGTVGDAQLVSAASDGSGNWPQIAVAADHTAVIAYYGFPSDAEIMVRALGTNGVPRGAAPLRVSQSTGKARFPSIAFLPQSGELGIAWNDTRDGNQEIYFARVRCAP